MVRILIAIILSHLLLGCGLKTKEELNPLYKPETFKLEAINVDIPFSAGHQLIETSPLQRNIRKGLKWLPGLKELSGILIKGFESAIGFVTITLNPKVPDEGPWKDPRLLKIVKRVRLKSGRVFGEFVFDPDKKPYPIKGPPLSFLNEIYLSIKFSNPINDGKKLDLPDLKNDGKKKKKKDKPENDEVELIIAQGKETRNLGSRQEILFLDTFEGDMRPYLSKYESFSLELIAEVKYPDNDVIVGGDFMIELVLNVDENPK